MSPNRSAAVLVSLCLGLVVCGCSSSDSDPPPLPAPSPSPTPTSKTGTYATNFGAQPRFTTTLTQAGNAVTWSLTGGTVSLSGTGTVSGDTVTLTGSSSLGAFSSTLTFSTPTSFSGTWAIGGGTPSGTISGSTTALPSYDLALLGVPKHVATDYIELAKIAQVSYFRSSAGHDYADDAETCRSMKHYYVPASGIDQSAIVIRSPVAGVVRGYTQESVGVQLGIESTTHPGVHFILFHVDLSATLPVGTSLSAGQVLGTHSATGHSDIAVGVVLPNGSYRLVSYLETLTDGLFTSYQARGLAQRSEAIHTEAARNADPLSCSGETFTTSGSLPAYLTFN